MYDKTVENPTADGCKNLQLIRETTRHNNNTGTLTFTSNNTTIVITIMCRTYSFLFVRPKTYSTRLLWRYRHARSFSPLSNAFILRCFENCEYAYNEFIGNLYILAMRL